MQPAIDVSRVRLTEVAPSEVFLQSFPDYDTFALAARFRRF
jgi:hypothetical protein